MGIDAVAVSRRFGRKQALSGVSLQVRGGDVHALLGPNGAGKTTLLRILAGLVDPDEGEVRVNGRTWSDRTSRAYRRLFGIMPSGDRSFYQRISGLENLIFFARLQGLSLREARERATRTLEAVDLSDAARVRVGVYSHGMQKRLSVARTLLADPPILLIDEATHDLDPEGARRIRDLARKAADRGRAVLWTTQRVEEIRGFADRVTVLHMGSIRFDGTVQALIGAFATRNYMLGLRSGDRDAGALLSRARDAVGALGAISSPDNSDGRHFLLSLEQDVSLGRALQELLASGVELLSCREEASPIEQAFLRLTSEGQP